MLEKVLSAIPDKLLEELSTVYQVDKKNTKLQGSLIFKGMLLNVLKNRPMSLRSLEDFINRTPHLHQGLKTHKEDKSK